MQFEAGTRAGCAELRPGDAQQRHVHIRAQYVPAPGWFQDLCRLRTESVKHIPFIRTDQQRPQQRRARVDVAYESGSPVATGGGHLPRSAATFICFGGLQKDAWGRVGRSLPAIAGVGAVPTAAAV